MGGEKRVNRSVRRISASRRTIQVTKHRGKRPVGADLERLVRAYRSGKTLAEVGCEFGLSPTGVLKILRQLGEPTRRPGKKTYSDGLTGYQRWRKRMQATPEGREHLRNRAHRRQLRREYGLTCEGYSALSAAQNDACAVCCATGATSSSGWLTTAPNCSALSPSTCVGM